jgi:hypothetical protein
LGFSKVIKSKKKLSEKAGCLWLQRKVTHIIIPVRNRACGGSLRLPQQAYYF